MDWISHRRGLRMNPNGAMADRPNPVSGRDDETVRETCRAFGLCNLHINKTLSWDKFAAAVNEAHKEHRMGEATHRKVVSDKPKE
ncbi:hypothetical protein Bca4012_052108 [Brassica carinata]